jgi:hypothetical protein
LNGEVHEHILHEIYKGDGWQDKGLESYISYLNVGIGMVFSQNCHCALPLETFFIIVQAIDAKASTSPSGLVFLIVVIIIHSIHA